MTVRLLQDYVTRQAERTPEALAVAMEEDRITYGELEGRTNRLARALREIGCRPGDRVCLFLPKSVTAIVAMLAVLKAECAYVPLDSNSPSARLLKIIESCDTPWLLTGSSFSDFGGRQNALLFPVMDMMGRGFGELKFGQASAYGFILTAIIVLVTAAMFAFRRKGYDA